jgi:hypothetical protein
MEEKANAKLDHAKKLIEETVKREMTIAEKEEEVKKFQEEVS